MKDTLSARAPGLRSATPGSGVPRLNLKALRLAVHGWWLGNPLVYKPGAADLRAIARELAVAGAASGTLVLDDMVAECADDVPEGAGGNEASGHHAIRAILLLPPLLPAARLGDAAAQAVMRIADATFHRPCVVGGRWHVTLGEERHGGPRFCSVQVDEQADIALVEFHFDLDQAERAETGTDAPAAACFARADWREVFLARVLHALDGDLRASAAGLVL